MKVNRVWCARTICILVATIGAPIVGHSAVQQPKSDSESGLQVASVAHSLPSVTAKSAQSVDSPGWREALRHAGASDAELSRMEQVLKEVSPADCAEYETYIQTHPSDELRQLRREIREEQAPAPAAIYQGAKPTVTCEFLRTVAIPDGRVDSATVDAINGLCHVTATVTHPPSDNHITIWIDLPITNWNGRFMGTGGGGYAGGFKSNLRIYVKKGFVSGATDTGNPDGTANFALLSDGKPAWERMRDNAYIGIHDMTVVGKDLTTAFYGKAPRYSYFFGGSTGGRQALTESQRYPKDYDGILALYPAIARDRYVPAQLWPQIVMHEANDYLSKEKRDAATAAAIKACDNLDGIADGIIDDPTRCHYDPAALVGAKIGDSTFTETDARLVREIWDGPRAHDATRIWWGPTRGTDLSTLANTNGVPLDGDPCGEGLDWFRFFLMLDANWNWKTLTRGSFELLMAQSAQEYSSIYGGDDPDLGGFKDRGGKLLIVHGLADNIVPPQESIAYLENVWRHMGRSEKSSRFVRLFLVPAGDHGFGNSVPSPSNAEMLHALLLWVEHGAAPQKLNLTLYGNGLSPVRTRPTFPYPAVAKYRGSGSIDDAANFLSSSPMK